MTNYRTISGIKGGRLDRSCAGNPILVISFPAPRLMVADRIAGIVDRGACVRFGERLKAGESSR